MSSAGRSVPDLPNSPIRASAQPNSDRRVDLTSYWSTTTISRRVEASTSRRAMRRPRCWEDIAHLDPSVGGKAKRGRGHDELVTRITRVTAIGQGRYAIIVE